MKIPFLDLSGIHKPLKRDLGSAFDRVLERSRFILGEECEEFEKEFAAYCGTAHCVAVGNGLDALSLSLRALNIGNGDEVIVPAHTFIATFLAVMQTGATPVPVEVRQDTMNMDPACITDAIRSKTKAIIPVHLYGLPCEMDQILAIAKKNQLHVIEDNAQAQGAAFRGARTGSFGILNATSFYPGKNLGALGDGGAITSSDMKLVKDLKMLRNYGSDKKYHHDLPGVNSRLDELQAAFLRVKLKVLDNGNKRRRMVASAYHTLLENSGDLQLPVEADGAESVFHLYVIRTSKREELSAHLLKLGIGSLVHYPIPPHKQKALESLKIKSGAFPITENISEQCLSIPCYESLKDSEVEYIAEAIKAFYHG